MHFSFGLLAAALAGYVSAQSNGPNAFNIPPAGYLLHAGQPQTLTWSNLAGSTVTLKLRDGANGALNPGTDIVANIQNTGTYTYTPPSDIVENNSYTIEIINDQTPSQVNYTPQFDILSPVKAVPTVSGATSVTATASSPTDSITSASTSMASGLNTASSSMASMSGMTTSTASATTKASSTASGTVATSAPSGGAGSALRVGGGILVAAFGFAVIF